MVSLSDTDEEFRFFDAEDSIGVMSDLGSGSPGGSGSCCGVDYWVSNSFNYDVWVKSPASVHERRSDFLRLMGLNLGDKEPGDYVHGNGVFRLESKRVLETSGAVLRNPDFEDEFSSSRSSVSFGSDDGSNLSRGLVSGENFICRGANLDNEPKENYKATDGEPSLVQKLPERQIEVNGTMARSLDRVRSRWLSRMLSMSCIAQREGRDDNVGPNRSEPVQGSRVRRVRVRQSKKKLKELSAVFIGQEIQAHEGSILSMKFSLDGQYLASAGEDGVVRIWQVVEDNRSNEVDIPDIDPSCVYFTVNHLSELAPLMAEKEKMSILKSLTKTADSACVIFPPKVFRILEKPLHEFRGHSGEVLDLSWSKSNCLLSSSVDETVRLWQVGSDHCLKVFPHSNYVTSVQFNPVDDNYFISGSIDGKVRIWSVNSSQVADWTDVREIVTAVTYSPQGQGGIIGSMTGNCRFFSVSDNHFQLEAQVCLNSKKKSPGKRIIGFQFYPQDPSRVMVICADSHVRILHGTNVIGKYKGPRNSGNQISANFTSDGKHIISACEDSNVYLWDCNGQKEPHLTQSKTIRSFECFSADASVALPWSGLKSGNSEDRLPLRALDESLHLSYSSPTYFTLGKEYFLESIPKGSATWPEEKLPSSSPQSTPSRLGKSMYKFLKSSCQSSSSCHAWGLVMVTAGWDGRIRSFHNYGLPVPL